ncbi:MAG: ATP-binding protein [Phycisphaerales bacterium]|nr:ATP-binding protein [Phycisphaerales bacterium]
MRFLHVIEGPDQGATYALPDHEPQLIGRSTEALPITDREVSRRHAELTPDGGSWYLRDLESTNGTSINGQLLSGRARLERGDRISCGGTTLLFDEAPAGAIPIRAIEPGESTFEVIKRHPGGLGGDQPFQHQASNAMERLDVLLRANDLAVSSINADDYLPAFMDLLLGAFEAEHVVMIHFMGSAQEASTIKVASRRGSEEERIGLSRELIRLVQTEDRTILGRECRDAGADAQATTHWLIGSPLRAAGEVCGVVCLEFDGSAEGTQQSDGNLDLFHALAGQAGMALERGALMSELLAQGRLAAMGETVAAISHGIKNILQGLRGGADAVQLAIERKDLDLAAKGWPIVSRNIERIQALTMNMLGFARQRALELERTSVSKVAREAVDMMEALTKRSGVSIEFHEEEAVPPIPIDSPAILQVLINLLSNAVESAPKGSAIELKLGFNPGQATVSVDVIDSGPGIDPVVRDHLFEPFVTTKGQRGTGLGLVVSRRIAERHGGTLTCAQTGPNGTRMRIELPADGTGEEPDDTHGPRGMPESDLDVRFGAPEH